jgi:hypothetical protein
LVAKRDQWNKTAPADYALPTESWREVVTRRKRCEDLRAKLAAGEVRDINDLITLNLDIRQFSQDVIENCEGPDLLRAFWHAIERITILDPTCGSGAFLFAALNILEPLYEACLERMRSFLEDLERSNHKHRPEKFADFRKVLERVNAHPNYRYFIFKSIILNNLFGVDIMEEAVEICKLRLFLKLAAQVEPDPLAQNIGIEPLPDIDFNIRAGNSLVGYASYNQLSKAVSSKLDFENNADKIAVLAADLQETFDAFRRYQTHGDGSVPTDHKLELRNRLDALEDELNLYLANEYGVKVNNKAAYGKWVKSYRPFHWFIEFYRVVNGGGFDVIIGNPPYAELSSVIEQYRTRNFVTEPCGNLYALCTERSFELLHGDSRFGFIVQQPVTSTARMARCREIILTKSHFVWCSTYDDRPSKLFDGIHHARLAIILAQRAFAESAAAGLAVTRYNKWFKDEREHIFARLSFLTISPTLALGVFPKICSQTEVGIIRKLSQCGDRLETWLSRTPTVHNLFYKITGVGSWFTITKRPPKFFREGKMSSSSRESKIALPSEAVCDRAFCILNSTLFFWFYQVRTNCRDFNPSDFKTFPVPKRLNSAELSPQAEALQAQLDGSAQFVSASHNLTGAIKYEQFRPRQAKAVIDEIDITLAQYYEFDEEECDFIVNYDIKYRSGRESEIEPGE